MYYMSRVETASCIGALMGSLRVLLMVAVARLRMEAKLEVRQPTWMESMSTEKTRAPSFASSAANGRPTTSDLCCSQPVPTT